VDADASILRAGQKVDRQYEISTQLICGHGVIEDPDQLVAIASTQRGSRSMSAGAKKAIVTRVSVLESRGIVALTCVGTVYNLHARVVGSAAV